MRLSKSLIVGTFLGGAFFISGCSQNIAKFSVATTGNMNMPSNLQKGTTVEGKDCITRVFGIPFGNRNNRVSNAVGKALEMATKKGQPNDALVNVDNRSSSWNIIIFVRQCIIAKGQPIGASSANDSQASKKESKDS